MVLVSLLIRLLAGLSRPVHYTNTNYFISDLSYRKANIIVPINKHNSKLSCLQAKCWKKREGCGSATVSHFDATNNDESISTTIDEQNTTILPRSWKAISSGEGYCWRIDFNIFVEFWADWTCQCYMPRTAHRNSKVSFGSHETALSGRLANL
jgi:hypothetical protein